MNKFDTAATFISNAVGHALAVPVAAILVAALWVFTGIDATNIAISIASLFLLFLLQHTQNRDGIAVQAKLDELIRSSDARNEFIGLDQRAEKEIQEARDEDKSIRG